MRFRFRKINKQGGVTLVELVISIIIISIALLALLSSFSLSIGHSGDPLWRNKTLKLAQLYLEEVLSKAYDEATPLGGVPAVTAPNCSAGYLGPDGGESDREDYDDVDDYDGFTESPPTAITGAVLSGYAGYSVSIEVMCDGSAVDAEDGAGAVSNSHAKRIELILTTPQGETMTFSSYKGNY